MNDKLQFLSNVHLFRNIPQDNIRELLDAMEIKTFLKGENIIREGERGSSLFFLFKGKVSVTKKMTLFADSQELSRVDKALINLKDTDYAFFGEMALFAESEERSATVTAESECILGELQSEMLFRLMKDSSEFGALFYRNLSKVLADRLRNANRDILKLTTALTLALEE
ncbi:MAG: cyclic nucleotide-binding domain-containing protein [Calditrichia bacterium]